MKRVLMRNDKSSLNCLKTESKSYFSLRVLVEYKIISGLRFSQLGRPVLNTFIKVLFIGCRNIYTCCGHSSGQNVLRG